MKSCEDSFKFFCFHLWKNRRKVRVESIDDLSLPMTTFFFLCTKIFRRFSNFLLPYEAEKNVSNFQVYWNEMRKSMKNFCRDFFVFLFCVFMNIQAGWENKQFFRIVICIIKNFFNLQEHFMFEFWREWLKNTNKNDAENLFLKVWSIGTFKKHCFCWLIIFLSKLFKVHTFHIISLSCRRTRLMGMRKMERIFFVAEWNWISINFLMKDTIREIQDLFAVLFEFWYFLRDLIKIFDSWREKVSQRSTKFDWLNEFLSLFDFLW